MDKWKLLKDYLKDRIESCEDECTEKDLSEVLRKMIELDIQEEENFYKGIVNESMKEVWDNDKDSIYDKE